MIARIDTSATERGHRHKTMLAMPNLYNQVICKTTAQSNYRPSKHTDRFELQKMLHEAETDEQLRGMSGGQCHKNLQND